MADRSTLGERLERHSIPEPNSGCWLWTAYCDGGGYGTTKHLGRDIRAHRASWIWHCGEIPAGMRVLHKCDNPSCINPGHLFLGTHSDNMRDCAKKGRAWLQKRPQDNRRAKLSPEDATLIRATCVRRDKTRSMSALAVKYGVSVASISAIVRGRSYPEAGK